MSFRAKIILYTTLGLVLLAVIILLLTLGFKKPTPKTAPVSGPGAIQIVPLAAEPPSLPRPVVLSPAELESYKNTESIKVAAKNFAERFGSYSVLANFSNFDELKTAVTASAWDWLTTYRQELSKKTDPNFVGVSTRVIIAKIISSNEDKATVLVSTQREETLAAGPKVSYRDLLIKLVLKNKQWLVDGAYWQ